MIRIKELAGLSTHSCLETLLRLEDGNLTGIEVVIDKDRASALLAGEIGAPALQMLTDVDGIYLGWGTSGPITGWILD